MQVCQMPPVKPNDLPDDSPILFTNRCQVLISYWGVKTLDFIEFLDIQDNRTGERIRILFKKSKMEAIFERDLSTPGPVQLNLFAIK